MSGLRLLPPPQSPGARAGHELGVRLASLLFGGMAVLVAASMPAGCLVFLWGAFVADAPLYVHHDGRGEVILAIDGDAVMTLREAGVTELNLPRGDHEVELRGETLHQFTLDRVTGLDEWMIRTNPDICFAVVDVTKVMYGNDDPCTAVDRARVTCIYEDFPKRAAGRPTFRVADLPSHPGRLETLWLPVPCDTVDQTEGDQEIAALLGCP